MKKLNFKNLLRIAAISLLLIVLGYFAVYLIIIEMGKNSHHQLIEQIESEMQDDLDYPKNFEKIMLKMRPTEKYIKTKSLFHDRVFATLMGVNKLPRTKYRKPYYSEEVFEIINNQQLRKQKWTNLFDEKMLFAIGLENKLSAKEIEKYYFLNRTIDLKIRKNNYKKLTGLQEFALERFEKNVEELEQIELIELFLLMDKNGGFYQEDEKRLKQYIKAYKHRLEIN